MLGRKKFQGGFKNGELYAKAAEEYVGGHPATIDSNGLLVLATSGEADIYVGIFANSATEDGVTTSANAQATYYSTPAILTLKQENTGSLHPYNTALTYNTGDKLYIGADGRWTNVQPGSNAHAGVVIGVGSNYIEVQFL